MTTKEYVYNPISLEEYLEEKGISLNYFLLAGHISEEELEYWRHAELEDFDLHYIDIATKFENAMGHIEHGCRFSARFFQKLLEKQRQNGMLDDNYDPIDQHLKGPGHLPHPLIG